jgi:hypothetical protein
MRVVFLLPTIALLVGCATNARTPDAASSGAVDPPVRSEITYAEPIKSLASRYVTTYYDRNHDGVVDFELHTIPGGHDTNWALSDTHFQGRYDLQIRWGYVLGKKAVDLPVPLNVTITPGQPPVSAQY